MWIEIRRAYGRDKMFQDWTEPEWKVMIKTSNGRKLMVSRAYSPRRIDAERIAIKLSKATRLKIRNLNA